jgi:hypothetical protein
LLFRNEDSNVWISKLGHELSRRGSQRISP